MHTNPALDTKDDDNRSQGQTAKKRYNTTPHSEHISTPRHHHNPHTKPQNTHLNWHHPLYSHPRDTPSPNASQHSTHNVLPRLLQLLLCPLLAHGLPNGRLSPSTYPQQTSSIRWFLRPLPTPRAPPLALAPHTPLRHLVRHLRLRARLAQ